MCQVFTHAFIDSVMLRLPVSFCINRLILNNEKYESLKGNVIEKNLFSERLCPVCIIHLLWTNPWIIIADNFRNIKE